MGTKQPTTPSSYDASTGRSSVSATRPIARATFSKDPASHAKQLSDLQAQVVQATSLARSLPVPTAYKNLIATAGTRLTVAHNLGRPAQWLVIGWRNASAGPSFSEVSRDNATLVLQVYVSGLVDLELR